MNLYYFTACNKVALKHLQDTIENPKDIRSLHSIIDAETLEQLKKYNCDTHVHMWGATPGSANILRWGKLQNDDRILAYTKKGFCFYGIICAKTHNHHLAEEVWGVGKDTKTWEYIYFLRDLQAIEISKQDFNKFFQYENSFNPQGFSNIDNIKLANLIDNFGSIDNAIGFLSNASLKSTQESFEKEKLQYDEKVLEAGIEGMSDDAFNKYLSKLDSAASMEIKEGLKKIRKYNKKIIDDLKKRYNYRCQVCGEDSMRIYGVSTVEGHHLAGFAITQNNKPENIMILCPNHHEAIHKAKGIVDKKRGVITYSNGFEEKIQLKFVF